MTHLIKIKKVSIFIALIVVPFLVQAQEIKVENGNVKVKTAGTVIEAKNGNVKVSTKANTTQSNSTKVGVKNITGNNIKQTLTCNGDDVVITGNENTIVIIGYVKTLKLTGSDNNIKLEKIVSIKTMGNDNEIMYRSSPNKTGKATISAVGSDNSIYKQIK